jgi:tRNA pseudouridine38-40 synthase
LACFPHHSLKLFFFKADLRLERDYRYGAADGACVDSDRCPNVYERAEQLYRPPRGLKLYKAVICYDGTHYFGWQKTKTGPSIQEEIEKAIRRITGEDAFPEAASRTDRGVHAEGQVVQFALRKELDPAKLLRGLNAVLPSDIRILQLSFCQFHPTLDAKGKEYRYQICQEPVQDPTLRLYSWHLPHPLQTDKMERAARDLIGQKDFTSFANEPEKNPLCTIEEVRFDGSFWIRGDRFLYKMVRNLVGTLIYIGLGKLKEDSIPSILAAKDRKKAGITAPALGLYLHQVFYPLN